MKSMKMQYKPSSILLDEEIVWHTDLLGMTTPNYKNKEPKKRHG